MTPLILASNSPRRKKIMQLLGFDFEVISPDPEAEPPVKSFSDCIIAARVKAHDVASRLSNEIKNTHPIVIGSDTVVVLKDEVLGKPKDVDDAFATLKKLSGKKHTVASGISLINVTGTREEDLDAFSTICKTEVIFRDLSDAEIICYINSGEPMDKAGSYAIQGDGGIFVESIHGCYNNVIGLPTTLLLDQLSQLNYQCQKSA